jgi:hypothetical protein
VLIQLSSKVEDNILNKIRVQQIRTIVFAKPLVLDSKTCELCMCLRLVAASNCVIIGVGPDAGRGRKERERERQEKKGVVGWHVLTNSRQ